MVATRTLSLMAATGKRTLAEYQPGALGEFLSSAAPPNKKKRAKVDHPFAVAVSNSSSDSSESDSDEEDGPNFPRHLFHPVDIFHDVRRCGGVAFSLFSTTRCA